MHVSFDKTLFWFESEENISLEEIRDIIPHHVLLESCLNVICHI